MENMKTTISLPPRIAEQAQEQIQQGWFSDLDSLIIEALRRYFETHPSEMMDRWILQDVEWDERYCWDVMKNVVCLTRIACVRFSVFLSEGVTFMRLLNSNTTRFNTQ